MKKTLSLLLALSMLFVLSACGVAGQAETKEPETWLMIEGDDTVYEIDYLHELSATNSLKSEAYVGKGITFVTDLNAVHGKTTLSFYKEVDSYLELNANHAHWFWVETSGMEDQVVEFEPGDLIKVTGKITSLSQGHIIMVDVKGFASHPQNITVEKVSE